MVFISNETLMNTNHLPVLVQVIGDFFSEDANVVFGIPPESLLEVGLPYLLK